MGSRGRNIQPPGPHHLNRALWCVPCVACASSLPVPVPVPDALRSRIPHPGQCRLCRAPGAGKRPVCTLPGLQKIPDAAAQRWHKQKTIGIVDDKRRARKTTRLSASSPLTRPPTDHRRVPLRPGPRAPPSLPRRSWPSIDSCSLLDFTYILSIALPWATPTVPSPFHFFEDIPA